MSLTHLLVIVCYSTAEYAAPVWERSAYAHLLNLELNQACRAITGCLRPTNVKNLYLLTGITPPEIRRSVCARVERTKQVERETHSMFGHTPARRRLKSRIQIQNPFLTAQSTQIKSVISVPIKDFIHHYPRALFNDIPRVGAHFYDIPGSRRTFTTYPGRDALLRHTRVVKSRISFLTSVQPVHFPAKVVRVNEWKRRLEEKAHAGLVNLYEDLAMGHDSPWLNWRCLNRLRTGYTCSKEQRKKWGYFNGNTTCECGLATENTSHMLQCTLLAPWTTF